MAEVDECAGRRHDSGYGRARSGRRRRSGTILSARYTGNPVNHETIILWAMHLIPLTWSDAVDDGERGRLDHTRRRLAEELAALALAQQSVSGICRTSCSARRRTERPGRSRSPFPTACFPLSFGTLKRELQLVGMANVVGVQPSGCPRL